MLALIIHHQGRGHAWNEGLCLCFKFYLVIVSFDAIIVLSLSLSQLSVRHS